MSILIFAKRYIKTPLFFLLIIVALAMTFLYNRLDLNLGSNIEVGVYSVDANAEELLSKLLDKSSFFSYSKYEDVNVMQEDIKKQKISYGFAIDFAEEKPFTIYGDDKKFSEIAKEDLYSTYFELLSRDYTKDLLNLSDESYKQKYEDEIKRTFKFEYVEQDVGKIFPIREMSSFFLFVAMLFVCLDYFNITSKSKFFETMTGRKNKWKVILTEIVLNAVVFLIILIINKQLQLLNFVIYNVVLFFIAMIIIDVLDIEKYMKFLPITIIFSIISIFLVRIDSAKFIYLMFPNNSYISSYNSNFSLIVYLAISMVIAISIRFKYIQNTCF